MADGRGGSGGGGGEHGSGPGTGGGWCTIESDPGVFTSLVESFGCRGAEFAELWSLDDDSLRRLADDFGDVYGLIFLFKWDAEAARKHRVAEEEEGKDGSGRKPLVGDDAPADLFFARQVTHNACATQAILSVLLNSEGAAVVEEEEGGAAERAPESKEREDEDEEETETRGGLVLGPTLSALKSFARSLPPDLRGEAISSSDDVRNAHNSFARRDAFLTDPEDRKRYARDGEEAEDVFHFVAYVPHRCGRSSSSSGSGEEEEEAVYELDGLNAGPISCGTFRGGDGGDGAERMLRWLSVARSAVQDRIERYAAEEIKFNLMAVVRDRRIGLRQKLGAVLAAAAAAAASSSEGGDDPSSSDLGEEAARLQAELEREREKRRTWEVENQRRRHNYLPFCVELLRALARTGKLPELTERANERARELRRKALEKKMAAAAGAAASAGK